MLRHCQGRLLEGEATTTLSSQHVCGLPYILITRTSIIYGGLGRIYGTYRGFGCNFRSYTDERTSERRIKIERFSHNGPTPNGPSLLHSPLSVEDAFSSVPSRRAVGVERQAQGLEYAGHRLSVVAEAVCTAEVPIQGRWLSWCFESGEVMKVQTRKSLSTRGRPRLRESQTRKKP